MIRSSLESEIYILQGMHTAHQAGAGFVSEAWWKKRSLLIILVAALLLALLAYRLKGASFQWNLFLTTFSSIDWRWLTGSIVLILSTYFGRALRWEVMLRPFGRTVSLRGLTYDTTIGFTAVVLLGRPGELVRPYLISVRTGLPFSSQMAAWILERMLDLLAVLLLFGYGLIRVPSHGLHVGVALRWILGVGGYAVAGIGATCVLLLVLFRNFSESAQQRILGALTFLPEAHSQRAGRMLATFSEGMQSTRNSRSLTLLLVYTGLEWAAIVGSYYALLHAFPASSVLTITDVVILLGFVAFGSIVQIPGVGGGVQLMTILVLSEIYGISLEVATGIALFLWIITFVVVVPIGFVFAFHEGINWSKLKHLPQDMPL